MSRPDLISRATDAALIGFGGLLGLAEGPAQIACVAALVLLFARGAPPADWRPGPFELGILLWALAGLPGLLLVDERVSSGDATRPLMALAALVGAWGLARASKKTLRRVATAFCVAMVINGAYGVLQYSVGELPFDTWILRNPKSGQIYIPGRVFHERAASGLYYNRLRLAHVGIVGLSLLGLTAAQASSRRALRVWAGLGLLVLGAAVALTYARTALVGLVAAAVAIAWVSARARLLSSAAVVAVSGVLAGAFFWGTEYGRRRFASLLPDLEIRRAMFDAALGMFEDHPVFGVGHGVYRLVVEDYARGALSGVHLTSPHNQWLQVLAETGLVGAVGFTVAGLTALVAAVRAVRRRRQAPELIDQLVLMGLVGLTVVGVFHSTLHHAVVGLVYWTLAGIAVQRGFAPGPRAS